MFLSLVTTSMDRKPQDQPLTDTLSGTYVH